MKRLTVIRALIMIEIASITISLLLYYLMPWPQSLHDFLEEPDVQGYISDALLLWLLIACGTVIMIAWIGLWRDWRPAKYFYLATLLMAVPVVLFSGPTAVLPTEEIFSGITYMASGALFFVLFIMPRLSTNNQ